MGVPLYGQSFTLDEPKENGEGTKVIWPGDAGEYTQQPGMLAYYEICSRSKIMFLFSLVNLLLLLKKSNKKKYVLETLPYRYLSFIEV